MTIKKVPYERILFLGFKDGVLFTYGHHWEDMEDKLLEGIIDAYGVFACAELTVKED